MLAEIIGDDPGDGIGGSACGAGGNDGDGARRKSLGQHGGGSQQPNPGGHKLAALHGFLLSRSGRFLPEPRQEAS